MPSNSLVASSTDLASGTSDLGSKTIQVMQAEIITLQKQLATAEHRSSMLEANVEDGERYRISAEEAQRRLVVGASAVEQAMQEAHTMRARATAAETALEEVRLQLEIARQEVTDEQQLGKRKMRELQREMADFRKAEAVRSNSFALHTIGAQLMTSTLRDARGWFEICKET